MEKVQSLAEFLGIDPDQGAPAPETFAELSVKDFCRGVLRSPEYRRSVYLRVVAGNLPSAVELRFYDYAEGKPVDRVEHTGKDDQPIEVITRVVRVVVDAETVVPEPLPSVTH